MQRPPVRIGIGTPAQRDALYKAGAEKVILHHEIERFLEDDVRWAAFRPGDTVILVQANLLYVNDMKRIAGEGVTFEIPGHEPRVCVTDQDVRELRKLKSAETVQVKRHETRGAKPIWPVPTEAQIQTMVNLWRTPGMKRSDVVARVREIMGDEVPDHWVRDQVLKATGTAARRPVET